MKTVLKLGEVVTIPDGREGLLLERCAENYVVRVRQVHGSNYQFLPFHMSKLKPVRTAGRFDEK